MKKLSHDDPRVKRLREAARAGKIGCADGDKIEALRPYIQQVLVALGFDGAFVTNESKVSDFSLPEQREAMIAKARDKLGVEISAADYLWQVAIRLQN